MEHAQDVERRLTDLEVKLSFAEDLVEQLNDTVFRQQQAIDMLVREVMTLRAQPQAGPVQRVPDERPPHY